MIDFHVTEDAYTLTHAANPLTEAFYVFWIVEIYMLNVKFSHKILQSFLYFLFTQPTDC
jgi:hypothetical protein